MAIVDNLLNLHRVDSQVRGLRSRLAQAERYLAGQEKRLGDLMRGHQELQQRRKQFQANIATCELDLKTTDARLEKLRNDLNGAATTKQHQAVLTEMNTVKTKRGEVEDRMLADMEQLEKLAEQFATLETQVAERTKVRDHARGELDERRADVGARLAELEVERQQAAALVPEKVLSIFEKLAEDFDGEAMAPLEEIDRRNREYACGACNMNLPFEQFSQLSSRGDAVVRCASCTRILYVREESRVTPGKK
jgi:predicted  nucleic acid-binding Zn-ribbon protein